MKPLSKPSIKPTITDKSSIYTSHTRKPTQLRKNLAMTALITATLAGTGCTSTSGYGTVAQNAMLGAATAAVTQLGGNSHDIKNAAGIGALLGILGSGF